MIRKLSVYQRVVIAAVLVAIAVFFLPYYIATEKYVASENENYQKAAKVSGEEAKTVTSADLSDSAYSKGILYFYLIYSGLILLFALLRKSIPMIVCSIFLAFCHIYFGFFKYNPEYIRPGIAFYLYSLIMAAYLYCSVRMFIDKRKTK